jgi:hypothetical protein
MQLRLVRQELIPLSLSICVDFSAQELTVYPEQGVESAHELKKSRPLNTHFKVLHKLLHKPTPRTPKNAPERPGIHLYFTTTYTKLSHFVIDRSSVQVRSSAPFFQ